MNLHGSTHFPVVPVVAAALGAFLLLAERKPWAEIGKALLWGGIFAALFASSSSC
jgi:hypothetical protein